MVKVNNENVTRLMLCHINGELVRFSFEGFLNFDSTPLEKTTIFGKRTGLNKFVFKSALRKVLKNTYKYNGGKNFIVSISSSIKDFDKLNSIANDLSKKEFKCFALDRFKIVKLNVLDILVIPQGDSSIGNMSNDFIIDIGGNNCTAAHSMEEIERGLY